MKASFFIVFFMSYSFLQSQNFWINYGKISDRAIYSLNTNSNNDIFCRSGTSIYRRLNNNDKWEELKKSIDSIRYNGIAIDNLGFLYTGIMYRDINLGWVDYIARSTDKGDSWEIYNKGIIPRNQESDTLADILGSNLYGDVFIKQLYFNDIYQLTDDENTQWKKISIKDFTGQIKDFTFDKNGNLFIVIDPWQPSGGDTNQVYKYDLLTEEWKKIGEPILESFVWQIAVDNDENIYVYREYKDWHYPDNWYDIYWIEVNKSGSNSWEKAKKISPELVNSYFHSISDIIITKENDMYMPYPGGLYKCNTSDYYFRPFNEGLPDSCTVTCLHLSGEGYLYLGTGGGEIYISREPVTDVEEDNKILDKKLFCYPNPTQSTIQIRYRIETAGIANVFLSDVLGKQTLLKSEYKFHGDYVEPFNLNGYPQGIYNVVLQNSDRIYSERILLLH
ncbi:MAG: T9SS type A sorting domain-containing protein [bacterium]